MAKKHDGVVPPKMTIAGDVASRANTWSQCFSLFMDEDSTMGRPFWAWYKRRLQESRGSIDRPTRGGCPQQFLPMSCDHERVLSCPWPRGGIPLVPSFCDILQLPHVAMKVTRDSSLPKSPTSANANGFFLFNNFCTPMPWIMFNTWW